MGIQQSNTRDLTSKTEDFTVKDREFHIGISKKTMKHLGFRHETAGILLADLKGCNLSWVGWCCHRQAFGRQVLGAERALWCLELCSLLFAWGNPWSTGRQSLVPWNAGSDPSVKGDRYTIYYRLYMINHNYEIYIYIYYVYVYISYYIYMYIYIYVCMCI